MTRPTTRVTAWPALMLALAVWLVGCSSQPTDTGQNVNSTPSPGDTATAPLADQNAALDAVVAAAQPSLPDLKAQFAGVYSDIQVLSVHPNTLEYVYVYADQVDVDVAATYFDNSIPEFQDAVDTQIFPAMASAGITDNPKVRYTYINADGTPLWSHTFEPS